MVYVARYLFITVKSQGTEMIQIRVVLAAMAATFLIGGCAVTATPVTQEELYITTSL